MRRIVFRFRSVRTAGRFPLSLAAAILAGLLAAAPVAAGDPPNIVFVVTDDHGVDAIEGPHWLNTLEVHTPTFATLAASGRSFTNHRVEPRCSPTRAGIMTGRVGHRTGVTGVLSDHENAPEIALQGEERTIAEVLRDVGYHTIHADKWHLAKLPAQTVTAQGFVESLPKFDFYRLDDPIEVGDEHVSRMVDESIAAVGRAPDDRPWALFLWHSDPHARSDNSGREPKAWWRVDESLLPSGEDYYRDDRSMDTGRDRYRAVVEAVDTETRRLIETLGVIDENLAYRPESNTLVIVMGDNGTPNAVAEERRNGKGVLFDGGIRVPLIFFGAGVPTDGLAVRDLTSHVDLYDTIADIAGASESLRRGLGERDGRSFADLVGWAPPQPRRWYTVSSGEDVSTEIHRAAITDGRWKLIVDAGRAGLKPTSDHDYYDLATDPREESPLDPTRLSPEEQAIYVALLETLADESPHAVSRRIEAIHLDLPAVEFRSLDSDGIERDDLLAIGHHRLPEVTGDDGPGSEAVESRAMLRFDMAELQARLRDLDRTLAEAESARLVLEFERDVPSEVGGRRTGEIIAYPMSTEWRDGPTWSEVENAFLRIPLGAWEPAPHMFPEREPGFRILPMPPGTPISLGRRHLLLHVLRVWHEVPSVNFGIVLRAERPEDQVGPVVGDERIYLRRAAFLRIAFPPR